MTLIENDHMVKQIPTAVTDPAFSNTILPRTSEAGSFRLNAEALQRVDHFGVELRAAIKNQVFGSRVVGECLAQLLDHPGATRMLRHVEVKDSPPVMRNDEKAI